MEMQREASLADIYLRGLQKRLGTHLRERGVLGVLMQPEYQEMALVWLDTIQARRQLRRGGNTLAIEVLNRALEDNYSHVQAGRGTEEILEDGFHAFRALEALGQPIAQNLRDRFGHMPTVLMN